MHPPRTLPQAYAKGPRGVLGGWAFSDGRVTPVRRPDSNMVVFPRQKHERRLHQLADKIEWLLYHLAHNIFYSRVIWNECPKLPAPT